MPFFSLGFEFICLCLVLIHFIRSIYSRWSAIWISCFVLLSYNIFAQFSSFFIWVNNNRILLPVEWPCIFTVVHLSYVYIFCCCSLFVSSAFVLVSVNVLVFKSLTCGIRSIYIFSGKSRVGSAIATESFAFFFLFKSFNYSLQLHDFKPCSFICQPDYYMKCLNKFNDSVYFQLLIWHSQCKHWALNSESHKLQFNAKGELSLTAVTKNNYNNSGKKKE